LLSSASLKFAQNFFHRVACSSFALMNINVPSANNRWDTPGPHLETCSSLNLP
jgi:hypothetical protein